MFSEFDFFNHTDPCAPENRVRGPYVVAAAAAHDVADVVPGRHHLEGKDVSYTLSKYIG